MVVVVVVVVVAVQCSATSAAHCVSESTQKANASQSPKSACFLLSVLFCLQSLQTSQFVHCVDRPTDDDHDHSLVCRWLELVECCSVQCSAFSSPPCALVVDWRRKYCVLEHWQFAHWQFFCFFSAAEHLFWSPTYHFSERCEELSPSSLISSAETFLLVLLLIVLPFTSCFKMSALHCPPPVFASNFVDFVERLSTSSSRFSQSSPSNNLIMDHFHLIHHYDHHHHHHHDHHHRRSRVMSFDNTTTSSPSASVPAAAASPSAAGGNHAESPQLPPMPPTSTTSGPSQEFLPLSPSPSSSRRQQSQMSSSSSSSSLLSPSGRVGRRSGTAASSARRRLSFGEEPNQDQPDPEKRTQETLAFVEQEIQKVVSQFGEEHGIDMVTGTPDPRKWERTGVMGPSAWAGASSERPSTSSSSPALVLAQVFGQRSATSTTSSNASISSTSKPSRSSRSATSSTSSSTDALQSASSSSTTFSTVSAITEESTTASTSTSHHQQQQQQQQMAPAIRKCTFLSLSLLFLANSSSSSASVSQSANRNRTDFEQLFRAHHHFRFFPTI